MQKNNPDKQKGELDGLRQELVGVLYGVVEKVVVSGIYSLGYRNQSFIHKKETATGINGAK
jgi:hypothetical protein